MGRDRRKRSKSKARKRERREAEKASACLFGLINRTATVAASAVAVGTLATSYLIEWPIGPIGEFVLIVLAALILGFHMFNFELRGFLGHRQVPEITRPLAAEFVLGCGVPYLVLLSFYYSDPTWSLFAMTGLVLLPSYFLYEPAQERIRAGVSDHDLCQGTTYFGAMQPLGVIGSNTKIKRLRDEPHPPNLQAFLAFFVGDPWFTGFSRTRTVILAMMIASSIVAFAAAAEVGVQEARHDKESTTSSEQKEQQSETRSEQPTDVAEAITTPAGEIHDPREDAGECRGASLDRAPDWARDRLRRLYLGHPAVKGANPPPGFDVGGCPGPVITMRTADGRFAYTIGTNTIGEVRSVAVDSARLGASIALAPAAQQVIDLIAAGEVPVGTYRTTDAAGGDLTPVPTPEGTVILVRSSKHPPGKTRYATPYVKLAPTASTAWVEAMNEVGEWMWPLQPDTVDGLQIFELVGRERRLRITYDPTTGVAQRGPFTYSLPEPQLSPSELEQRAATAWYGAPTE